MLVVVDGIVLITGGEEEDAAVAALVGHAGAEDLAAREGGEEHQLVGCRDVEELAVHLLLRNHERLRHALRDGVCGVDGPHEFTVLFRAPPQCARCTHELAEDLRPMAGVQHEQAHACENVPVHALDDLVGDFPVGGVAPPDEHVGGGEDLFGEPVLWLVQRGGRDLGAIAQVLDDALGDCGVHAVGIDRADLLLDLLVAVLAPDENANGGFGCCHDGSFFGWEERVCEPSVVGSDVAVNRLSSAELRSTASNTC